MAAKRAAKAKEEAKEHLANEAIRRKGGRVRAKLVVLRERRLIDILQDLNEIREELKAKEIQKDLEAKKRGTSVFVPLSSVLAHSASQRNWKKRKRAHASRPKSRPTSVSERRRQQGRKRYARASPYPGAPPRLPRPQQRPPRQHLKQQGKTTPTRVCRSDWRAGASRTRRRSRATPVRSCPFHIHVRSAPLAESVADRSDVHIALREVAEFLAGQTLSVDAETVTFAMHFPRCVPPRCGVMRARVGPGAHAVRALFVMCCSSPWCAGRGEQEAVHARRLFEIAARSGPYSLCGACIRLACWPLR